MPKKRADALKRGDVLVDCGQEFKITKVVERRKREGSVYYIKATGLETFMLNAHEKVEVR
jgi:hypothetical protein